MACEIAHNGLVEIIPTHQHAAIGENFRGLVAAHTRHCQVQRAAAEIEYEAGVALRAADMMQIGDGQRLGGEGDIAKAGGPRRRVDNLLGAGVDRFIIRELDRAANHHRVAGFAKLGFGTVLK